jgi:hypothetical protein
MVLIELALMWSMYKCRAANTAIAAISVIAFAVFWFGIRQQVAIADEQFLNSMIPHHAGAILMCGQAPVQDEEVKSLCQNIINSQQSEIEQMEAILGRLGHS